MENVGFYEICKTLHVISVIAWFAGLFYLPRLFVYHAQNQKNQDINDLFKIMEKKLYYYIMTPAMLSSLFFGLGMIHEIGFNYIWLHIKILLVLILIFYHHFLGKCRKNFFNNKNIYSEKFYRIINEIPTILLILIAFLAIAKPF